MPPLTHQCAGFIHTDTPCHCTVLIIGPSSQTSTLQISIFCPDVPGQNLHLPSELQANSKREYHLTHQKMFEGRNKVFEDNPQYKIDYHND